MREEIQGRLKGMTLWTNFVSGRLETERKRDIYIGYRIGRITDYGVDFDKLRPNTNLPWRIVNIFKTALRKYLNIYTKELLEPTISYGRMIFEPVIEDDSDSADDPEPSN